ncbi:hypothetical protein HMPREF2137_04545 [Hoylesella buccalis DNF00853]|uniref:Uncharacterized protein n=1 Tax=Hoylesella buccalis DNF00853 TaxID=1401074 RepID=A0A095ZMA4_9BACT|nr:hypothetical protein HMPREF2137_04545 [Hoylesella buccalis DNF00853]
MQAIFLDNINFLQKLCISQINQVTLQRFFERISDADACRESGEGSHAPPAVLTGSIGQAGESCVSV